MTGRKKSGNKETANISTRNGETLQQVNAFCAAKKGAKQLVLRNKKRTYPTPSWRVGGAEGPLRSRVPLLALGKGMWPCPLRVPW
jgi:hypothetical protein